MIEILLGVICLLLLKIAHELVGIASAVRAAAADRPHEVNNRNSSVDRIIVAINKLPDRFKQ